MIVSLWESSLAKGMGCRDIVSQESDKYVTNLQNVKTEIGG